MLTYLLLLGGNRILVGFLLFRRHIRRTLVANTVLFTKDRFDCERVFRHPLWRHPRETYGHAKIPVHYLLVRVGNPS